MYWLTTFVFISTICHKEIVTILSPAIPSIFPNPYALTAIQYDPKVDAEDIVKSKDPNEALTNILTKRDYLQRQQISAALNEMNLEHPFYPKDYKLLMQDEITDLKFAMNQVLPYDLFLEYLNSSLELKKSYWWGPFIIAVLTVADLNRRLFMELYKMKFDETISHGIEHQGGDYLNFLNEIRGRDRQEESTRFEDKDVNDMVKNLKGEKHNWKDDRKYLDEFLITKSRTFITKVVPLLEKQINQTFNQTIMDNIHDVNLQIGYNFLLQYAFNPDEAIATRIHDAQTDPIDHSATKIAFIVGFSENALANINIAFLAKYKITISDFLLKSGSPTIVDKILAAFVDNASSGSSAPGGKPKTDSPPAPGQTPTPVPAS